ncbi:MAG: hypothetical protein M3Z09_18390 [Acidobacteriota bacterium]|nr:hypothetical protein [Acidobacteriota bacterium]
MRMRVNRKRVVLLAAVWSAFFLRGLFYCVQQPMWEGYDEWAHFAYVQHIAETGTLPLRTEAISMQVQQSLQLAPLSRWQPKRFPERLPTIHFGGWRPASDVRWGKRSGSCASVPGLAVRGRHRCNTRRNNRLFTKAYTLVFAAIACRGAGSNRTASATLEEDGMVRSCLRDNGRDGGMVVLASVEATGTLSGEQLDIAAKSFKLPAKLSAVSRMRWGAIADNGAFSFIWMGGLSFLVVRSWMYRVFEFAAALAVAGLVAYAIRKFRRIGLRRG